MRRQAQVGLILAIAAILSAGVSYVMAQGAPRTNGPAPAQNRVVKPAELEARQKADRLEQVLTAWETQSVKLKTLDVKIREVDKQAAWPGDDVEFYGRAILKSPNLAWLNFDMIVKDKKTNKNVTRPFERILCTGNEVWHYRSETQQIFIFPLGKDQKQRALDQGPLPFLFNMKKAEVKARYEMDLIKEEPTFFVIGVIPLKDIDQQSFSKAFIQLEKKFLLPTRIVLVSQSGKDTKDYTLSAHKPNAEVADGNFKGVLVKGWDVVRNPAEGNVPPPGRVRGPGGGARPSAVRPGGAPDRR